LILGRTFETNPHSSVKDECGSCEAIPGIYRYRNVLFQSTAMYHPNISLADSNIGNDVAIEKSFYGAGILLMAALA
jgi:hypothetical protein